MIPFKKQNIGRYSSACGKYLTVYFSAEEMVDGYLQYVNYSYTLDVESWGISGSRHYTPNILGCFHKKANEINTFSLLPNTFSLLPDTLTPLGFISLWKSSPKNRPTSDAVDEEVAFQKALKNINLIKQEY